MIAAQESLFAMVPTLQQHLEIGAKSNGCRITDFSSSFFATAGPKADKLRLDLVTASAAAMEAFNEQNFFHIDQAKSVMDEFIVAANNDLFLSETTEALFGTWLPDWESLGGTFMHGKEGEEAFDDACLGLLIYRAWKILLRVPSARAILLSDSEEVDIPQDRLNSFEAVRDTLALALVEDRLCAKFIECVNLLPTNQHGKKANNMTLNESEKSFILQSCEKSKWPSPFRN